MNRSHLFKEITNKRSFLCIGLDTDIERIPAHLLSSKDPIFEFNKQIIDETHDLCVAYKPNLAFYESMGSSGWDTLQKTLEYIPKNIFKIADAKRGDIGNTSAMYAKAFFHKMNCDAITISPYMGADSVLPFLSFKDKWVILLALTSNSSSLDFQYVRSDSGKEMFKKVIDTSKSWGTNENMMYVVGATQSEQISQIRSIIPDHFLLVPGIGSQGGDLHQVAKYGMNKECGLLVNSSRSIIYASSSSDFAKCARKEAESLQKKMDELLSEYI